MGQDMKCRFNRHFVNRVNSPICLGFSLVSVQFVSDHNTMKIATWWVLAEPIKLSRIHTHGGCQTPHFVRISRGNSGHHANMLPLLSKDSSHCMYTSSIFFKLEISFYKVIENPKDRMIVKLLKFLALAQILSH